MNEKIKQLYLEAAKWADQQDEDLIAKMLIRDEKFAELIVNECIDIANDTRYDGKVVANRIKFVFGVE